jgi:hypothetical protein
MAITDLFISEYIEGSGNNKAIELYNGTGAAIDMGAGQYVLQLFSNGSASPGNTLNLTGVIAAGATYVIANASANAAIQAVTQVTSAVTNFNGDDALVLRKGGASGTILDSIGQVGVDPGASWSGGGVSTVDQTLIRKPTVQSGDTNTGDAFDPSLSFDSLPQDTTSNLGSHTVTGGGATVSINDVTLVEGNAGTSNMVFTVTRSDNTTAFSVDVSVGGGTATSGTDYATFATQTLTFAAGGPLTQNVTVVLNGDTTPEASETLNVTLSNLVQTSGTTTITDATGLGTITNDDGVALTAISAIQGSGATAAITGLVTIEGIVTGDFQNNLDPDRGNIGGFFVQQEVGDGNAATSDGIFVFQGANATSVSVGDRVQITGTVAEFNGETQISITGAGAGISVVAAGALTQAQVNALAADVNLPTLGTTTNSAGEVIADLEAYEGMLIRLPQTLTVSETFNLDRFGIFELTQGGQAFQYAQQNTPDVAGYAAFVQDLAKRTITVDDGFLGSVNPPDQNPSPITVGQVPLTASSTFSHGDTITGLIGNVRFSTNTGAATVSATDARHITGYRLVTTENPVVVDANTRDNAPEPVGGTLKVASFNVLNFFTSLNPTSGNDGSASGNDPRGANNNAEYLRQEEKLYTTLALMNADIVGLIEIENDFRAGGNTSINGSTVAPGAGGLTAIQAIVDGVNSKLGSAVYDWVRPGSDLLGGDAIAVGMIYKTASVSIKAGTTVKRLVDTGGGTNEPAANTDDLAEIGQGALIANDGGIGLFEGSGASRVPLAVTFEETATGEAFTVAVNHFKSKGSSSGGTGDADIGNGAAASNNQRVESATALAAWLAANPTGDTSGRNLIIGDLNAYAKEQPITYLESQGYVNLSSSLIGPNAYSYVFDGQLGTLDYGLAAAGFTEFFTGATDWHINSDEPDAFDYNTDFGKPANIFDATSPIRTSDHDPFIMGLDLAVNFARFGDDTFSGQRLAGTKLLSSVLAGAQDGDGIDVVREAVVGNAGGQTIGKEFLTFRADAGFTASFTLAAAIQVFETEGTANLNATGNNLANYLGGNAGANTLSGGGAGDYLDGKGGIDTLNGEAGEDYLLGGEGGDTLNGGEDDDFLDGGLGDDTLNGGGGASNWALFDTVNLGVVVDLAAGTATGQGSDTLTNIVNVYGSDQGDTLAGTAGVNLLIGRGGDDTLRAGAGDDYVSGGEGADTLFGDGGADYLLGNAGADIFSYTAFTDSDTTTGSDYLEFSSGDGDKINLATVLGGQTASFNTGFGTGFSLYTFDFTTAAMVQLYQGTELKMQLFTSQNVLAQGDFLFA